MPALDLALGLGVERSAADKLGGKARAAAISPERRAEIARAAAVKRWAGRE